MSNETTETKVEEVKATIPKSSLADIYRAKTRLELILTQLYNHPTDRYYAHLFFQIDRVCSDQCQTFGVGMQQGRIKLYYSPTFLATLTDEQTVVILKHEALHLINDHIARGQGGKQKDKLMHQKENISMDCAINQYLDHATIEKIGGVTLQRFQDMLTHLPTGTNIEPKRSYEYYMDLLNKEQEHREENGEDGEGQGLEGELGDMEMDDHGQFGEMDALDKAMLEDKIKKAAKDAKAAGAGNLPQEVEELMKIKKTPQLNWKRAIKQFVGQGLKAESKMTRGRRNRRFGLLVAGKKKDHIARILVVLDTSGSMSWNNRTEKVLSELYGVWKANPSTTLDICEFDYGITNIFTYDGSTNYKTTGGGGTCPNFALKYAEKEKYDKVILLSDCEFFNEIYEPRVSTLFVCVDNPTYKAPYGKTVHLE